MWLVQHGEGTWTIYRHEPGFRVVETAEHVLELPGVDYAQTFVHKNRSNLKHEAVKAEQYSYENE